MTADHQFEIFNKTGQLCQNSYTRINQNTIAVNHLLGPNGLRELADIMETWGMAMIIQEPKTIEKPKKGLNNISVRNNHPPQRPPRTIDNEIPNRQISICANCRQLDQTLAQCVSPISRSGDIPGCYRCNTLNHAVDDCKMEPLSDRERWQSEVRDHAGMPPLRSLEAGPRMLELELTPNRKPMTVEEVRQLPDQGYKGPHPRQSTNIPSAANNARGSCSALNLAPLVGAARTQPAARASADFSNTSAGILSMPTVTGAVRLETSGSLPQPQMVYKVFGKRTRSQAMDELFNDVPKNASRLP
ncbi:hypothetical protein PG989_001914 [Apiospora arundinis]|uniref:CCHC-type domain-containing protein n=1 Tax=Apiospora arundinis TaxID=335852 RepID=A0ABR2HNW2_9PEZI